MVDTRKLELAHGDSLTRGSPCHGWLEAVIGVQHADQVRVRWLCFDLPRSSTWALVYVVVFGIKIASVIDE